MDKVIKDIRANFASYDNAVLVNPAELAGILAAPSAAAVYKQLERGQLPKPIVHRARQIRWSVGQIRDYLDGLVKSPINEPQKRTNREGMKKLGRPRKVAEAITS